MHRTYITVFTPEMWPMLIPPLASYCPLFLLITPFYLLGEPAFLLVVRIPIHSCPWFAINCSPFATSPTPTQLIDQVTIFTLTTSTTSAFPADTTTFCPFFSAQDDHKNPFKNPLSVPKKTENML